MPELEAYCRSQRPHQHDWTYLGADGQVVIDWCAECGATRRHDDAGCPELDG